MCQLSADATECQCCIIHCICSPSCQPQPLNLAHLLFKRQPNDHTISKTQHNRREREVFQGPHEPVQASRNWQGLISKHRITNNS